jgi:hypothetical protein
MNRWYLFMVFVAFPAMILAQTGSSQPGGPNYSSQPYTPAVPAASMVTGYGGYPGYVGGGTTAAGSAMNGLGNAMSSAGSMHLSNSAAAINMTQAQKNEIQNRQLGETTYFQMRSENQAWQKAQQGPQATKEQVARWARDAAPKPVTTSEVDPTSGKINWPDALTQDSYAPQRANLDQLLAKKATYGRLSYEDQGEARKTIENMFGMLKSQIKEIPPQQYADSRSFLRSIIYATSKSELN